MILSLGSSRCINFLLPSLINMSYIKLLEKPRSTQHMFATPWVNTYSSLLVIFEVFKTNLKNLRHTHISRQYINCCSWCLLKWFFFFSMKMKFPLFIRARVGYEFPVWEERLWTIFAINNFSFYKKKVGFLSHAR